MLWVEDKLNKLKTSVEAFFMNPEEETLVNMIDVLDYGRGVKSMSGKKP